MGLYDQLRPVDDQERGSARHHGQGALRISETQAKSDVRAWMRGKEFTLGLLEAGHDVYSGFHEVATEAFHFHR